MDVHFEITQHFLDDRGQRSGFILLGSFLAAFLFIRTSARLIRSPKITWWPGSVKTKSGLHLHHLVWGIVLMMASGFLNFVLKPGPPYLEILAAAFGVGAGLTLDEFALWVRLEDVYWSEEGRISLDAVVVATLLGGLIVLGLAPFDLSNQSGSVELARRRAGDRRGPVRAGDLQGQAAARPDRRVRPGRLARRRRTPGLAELALGAAALFARRGQDGALEEALRTREKPQTMARGRDRRHPFRTVDLGPCKGPLHWI